MLSSLLMPFAAVAIGFPLHAQQNSGYLTPQQASQVSPGKAPGMKVQLLTTRGDGQKEYAVIFSKGDEAFSGLSEFAQKYNVGSAHFTAIGAMSSALLGWFDPAKKMYRKIPVDTQAEAISVIGDIAMANGKPVVHTHMIVGFSDGSVKAGHVIEAHVFPTLEVLVTVDPATMKKRFDPETDLTLIDPALNK